MKEELERHVVGGIVNAHKTLTECREEKRKRKNVGKLSEIQLGQYKVDQEYSRKKEELAKIEATLKSFRADLGHDPAITEEVIARLEAKHRDALVEANALEQRRDSLAREVHELNMDAKMLLNDLEEKDLLHQEVAELRKESEKKPGEQFLKLRREQLNEIERMEENEKVDKQRKMEVARGERKKARQRVMGKKQEMMHLLRQVKSEYNAKHKQRTSAILQLKQNTENVNNELQGENNRRRERQMRIARKEKEEFDKILALGGNPYEVFRRRKQEAKVKAAKARITKKLKQSEMQCAKRMIAFDEYVRAKDDQLTKEKEYKEQYNKSLGRHLQEEHTRKYMQSHTIGGVDFIDPGGRAFRIEPSQAMVAKTHAFGLGKTYKDRPDIVESVLSRPEYKDSVKPNMRLIPAKLRPYVEESKMSAESMRSGNQDSSASLLDMVGRDQLEGVPQYPGVRERAQQKEPPNDEHIVVTTDSPIGVKSSSAADMDHASQERAGRKYVQRKLSVLEERALKEARERQRRDFVKDQITWGKKYEGCGFLAKPRVIHFKDFEVGEKYTKTFTLTNVSYTFNNFKLLELPSEVMNFFSIVFEKPGRMSAGLTCKLQVEFEPKMNQDIEVEVPFLASTGKFSVPIKCTARRVKPSLSTKTLNFGTVVIGETKKLALTMKNDGFLRGNYSAVVKTESNDFVFACASEGVLDGYSESVLLLEYRPVRESADKSVCILEITVTSEETPPTVFVLECNLRGKKSDVPIYVENPHLDFQCCAYGKFYRNKLIIKNRGSVAFRLGVKVPKGLQGIIEFLPDMAFIQGRDDDGDGSFEIQVKFCPTADLTEWYQKEHGSINHDGQVEIPIKIQVPDQVLPVPFSIKAKLTHSDIEFSPASIDFGECYTSQSVRVPLSMTNQSLLPQKFGFVKLKPQVELQPTNGFGTLLPNESDTQYVVFSPTASLDYNFSILCRTSLNRQFTIDCKGTGLDPPISFSNTRLSFRATGLGMRCVESIFVENLSLKEPRTIHFVVASKQKFKHGLKFSPAVLTLSPGELTRVEVEFVAQSTIDEEDVADVPEDAGKVSRSGPGEPWSKHCEWVVRCFVQKFEIPLLLQVSTTTVNSEVVADKHHINFNQVAVGHTKTLVLKLQNKGNCTAKLAGDTPNPVGPFSVVNALRDIPPGGTHNVILKFLPEINYTYREILNIWCRLGKLEFILSGQGVSPELEVEVLDRPKSAQASEDADEESKEEAEKTEQGDDEEEMFNREGDEDSDDPDKLEQEEEEEVDEATMRKRIRRNSLVAKQEKEREKLNNTVDFGDVLVGKCVERRVRLSNKSAFGLDFVVVRAPGTMPPPENFNGLDVFSVSPEEAHIDAGESTIVTFEFAPDQVRLDWHKAIFVVDVPNQVGQHRIRLQGRCWGTALYAHIPMGGTIAGRDSIVNMLSRQQDGDYTILVDMDDLLTSTVSLVVGSCDESQGGSFELLDVPDPLQVAKASGKLKANSSESVSITLKDNHPNRIGEHEIVCQLTHDTGLTRTVTIRLKKQILEDS